MQRGFCVLYSHRDAEVNPHILFCDTQYLSHVSSLTPTIYWLFSGVFCTNVSVSNDSWNALVLFIILSFSLAHTYTGGLNFFQKKQM